MTAPLARQLTPLLSDNSIAMPQPLFEAANAFLGASLEWQPIEGSGSTNALYRTQLSGQSLVLRLNGDDTQAFGVARQAEATVLAMIQGYPWAPQVLHNDWQAGWCLMEDHGVSPDSGGAYNPAPALLEAVAQWQRIDTGPVSDYPALFENYRGVLGGTRGCVWLTLLVRIKSVIRALPEVPACLTHHDLHRGNLCVAGGRLVVVDWEYATIGNPWFDAASLHRQLSIPGEAVSALPAWRELEPSCFQEGLAMSLWLTEALECLWYEVRERCSGAGSDRTSQAERLLRAPLS
ncbi:MAG: phosphotransferase [Motiliproteus sp.]